MYSKSRLGILSDLFTNLAAGWFGSIIVFPNLFQFSGLFELLLSLTLNFLLGILSLVISIYFKEYKV